MGEYRAYLWCNAQQKIVQVILGETWYGGSALPVIPGGRGVRKCLEEEPGCDDQECPLITEPEECREGQTD